MLLNREFIALLFIIFGLLSYYNIPGKPEQEWQIIYSTTNLLRGWGIYSITVGMILLFPDDIKTILQLCFIVSMMWHADIAQCRGWNKHHYQAIYANLFALCITF